MTSTMFAYSKRILESVSFDPNLFRKELKKALKSLLPYEIEQLKRWLQFFIQEKPELEKCLKVVN